MYTAKFLPEIELRKTKLQNAMKNAEADAMLISSNTNLFYTSGRIFCGYTYIPVEGEILFFVRSASISKVITSYIYVNQKIYLL